jgi:hypothetical protein
VHQHKTKKKILISFSLFLVEIRLHEPLIIKPGSRKKRIGLQVLNALARLEVLLSKEEMLASSETGVQNLKQVCVVKDNVVRTTKIN